MRNTAEAPSGAAVSKRCGQEQHPYLSWPVTLQMAALVTLRHRGAGPVMLRNTLHLSCTCILIMYGSP